MTTESLILKTIAFEGGAAYTNDPDDSGGETKFGISKRAFPDIDIAKLTEADAIKIYKTNYYDPMGCEAIIDEGVRWKAFDLSVNLGISAATKIIQRSCGAEPDGVIGPKTIQQINFFQKNNLTKSLIDLIVKNQILYYTQIVINNPKNIKFLKGWINRSFAC